MPVEREAAPDRVKSEPPRRPSFEIPASVLYREVEKQMVLLNIESEQYFGLNEVGADIVRRLTEEPLEEAFTGLAHDYEVDPDTLHRDVHAFIEALERAGLLERLDSPE